MTYKGYSARIEYDDADGIFTGPRRFRTASRASAGRPTPAG